jgi:mandelate racemase
LPLTFVLGTSQDAVREAPLVLIDLETEEGVTGRAWLFAYVPAAAKAVVHLLGEVAGLTRGAAADPAGIWAKLTRRFTLIGVQGVVRMAMAGFDIACWDALSVAARTPLARFLGGYPRPIPAYNSCGLGLTDDLGALSAEAEALLATGGFGAVKLRLGYPTLAQDMAAVHAVRQRIGRDALLMVDYNQALSADDALVRGRALDQENIYWLEEPVRHDDYASAAKLTGALRTPMQLGENFSLPTGMEAAIAQHAADYVMPDIERIGGVTGWREAARIAAAHKLPMSSHLFPEVSVHLLAATPTCHFLEYVDWANVLLQEPLRIEKGCAIVPERPGNGMIWDEAAVERFRMD